jgi:putative transposase
LDLLKKHTVYAVKWSRSREGREKNYNRSLFLIQNSFIERFNRTYREAVLSFYVFKKLSEVREVTDRWLKEYNEERPHQSLGKLTTAEYAAVNQKAENSNLAWH